MNARLFALFVLVAALFSGMAYALTPISGCSDLSVSGETYSLQNDAYGSMKDGNCMHITADRVTLLCNGYGITSDDTSVDEVGINVGGEDATVRGCHVSGYTYDSWYGFGLTADGYDGLVVEDSSFDENDYGLHAVSSNAAVSRSSADGNGYNGFHFFGSSYVRMERNNATSNGVDGIVFESVEPQSYNNLSFNLASGNKYNGFRLTNDDNDRLVGNNATGNGANGFLAEFTGGPGTANNNTFINNSAMDNGYGTRCFPGTYPCPRNGFVLDGANGTRMGRNYAYANAGYGFFVYRGEGNVLDSNTASNNEEGGFMVSAHEDTRRSHNNLTNNTAYRNGLMGFYIRDDSNYLARNNASGNGESGFYLDQPYCFSWACSGNDNTLEDNVAEYNGFGEDVICPGASQYCYDGFTLASVNGTAMSRNRAIGNNDNGFSIISSSFSAIDSNTASVNGFDGFLLSDSVSIIANSYNNLTGNIADSNYDDGFEVADDHNRLVRNTASDNGGNGFALHPPSSCGNCSGEYNELVGNTAYGNGWGGDETAGFMVVASRNTLEDNAAYGNYMNGFWVDSTIVGRVTGVTLSGNRAYGHHNCGRDGCTGAGFKFSGTTVAVYSAFGADMADNLAYGNDFGVLMFNGALTMSEDRLYNNTIDLDASNPSDRVISALNMSRVVFDSDKGLVTRYTTLSLNDSLYYDGKSMSGEHYSIDHAVEPDAAYPYGVPFHGKFVNITDYCESKDCLPALISRAAWHWTVQEENEYENITLWEYDGRWALRNESDVDQALSLTNLSGFSVFGLFANYTPVDDGDQPQQPGGEEGPGQNGTQPQPECSSDDDCAVNEVCSGSACIRFPCECGAVQGHRCVQYECCSDSQCSGGGSCDASSHTCRQEMPQYECTSDLQCPAQDYCLIPAGAGGGACEPVEALPCGEVRNHSFVAYGYECGSEPGCPACPQGSGCEGHICAAYQVTCPTTGIVGEEKGCAATREGAPCALCDYSVTAPDGGKSSGRTDEEGNFRLSLGMNGTYMVSLLSGGQPVQAIDVKAFPKGSPGVAPEKPEAGPDASLLLWILLLLALLAIGVIYWRSRGQKKK